MRSTSNPVQLRRWGRTKALIFTQKWSTFHNANWRLWGQNFPWIWPGSACSRLVLVRNEGKICFQEWFFGPQYKLLEGGCGAMVSNCPFYVEALYDQEKMPKNAKLTWPQIFFLLFFWGGGQPSLKYLSRQSTRCGQESGLEKLWQTL